MLQITELTLRIAGRPLLEGASLTLPAGFKAGFVGRNGAGKTTLFRAIAGDIAPDAGSISLPKGTRIGRVEQEAPSGPRTLVETVLAADRERAALLHEAEHATDPHRIAEIHTRLADIRAHEAEARAARILAGLGFDAAAQARPCSDFSGGWRMRVALAGVLFSAPDLLLLDEPTNYLDLEGTLWLERYLARYPHSAIVISHDRDLLNNAVDCIIHLFDRKLTFWRGGYDAFERQYREQQILQGKLKAKQEAERKHMEAFVERFRAKASKARQAQSRLKALAKLQPIAEITRESVLPFRFPNPQRPAAPPIIRMEDVAVGYQPGRPVLSRLNLRIDDDDRIALLGTNGNGKSTFAKLVAGALPKEMGEIVRAPKLKTGLFAQHQLEALDPAQSACQHVRALMVGAPEAQVRSRVAQMGLATHKMDTPAKDLSGGEKARLMMGLAAFDAPHLLILDEPTNHLDIDSREALVMALNDYQGAVILISHDRHLIEACADRLWLVAEGTVTPFDGDIEDYRRQVLGRTDSTEAAAAKPQRNATQRDLRREAAERREALAPLRKKIKDCEKLIERLRAEIQQLDGQLAAPDLYAREPDKAAEIARRRAERVHAFARAESDWLDLSEELESLEAQASAA
ncbi:MAG TPA: ABC-F family ATP-binding cassette domain-containing protein [Propylenella sp.]|nr:ABC-F family ATP-binding cassette domain-containing protein [Propylenella sp.]